MWSVITAASTGFGRAGCPGRDGRGLDGGNLLARMTERTGMALPAEVAVIVAPFGTIV
jgi:hypothetical protein